MGDVNVLIPAQTGNLSFVVLVIQSANMDIVLTNFVNFLLNVLRSVPEKLLPHISNRWDLRQHRKNYKWADVDNVWENAVPGISRHLKNHILFQNFETDTKVMDLFYKQIDRSLAKVIVSKCIEPTGIFVIKLKVPQFWLNEEQLTLFRKIIVEEITLTLNRHFELDLVVTEKGEILNQIQEQDEEFVSYMIYPEDNFEF